MAAVTPEIVGRNFEVTPDIRELIESKLGKVEDRLFQDVVSVRVMLHVYRYFSTCSITRTLTTSWKRRSSTLPSFDSISSRMSGVTSKLRPTISGVTAAIQASL